MNFPYYQIENIPDPAKATSAVPKRLFILSTTSLVALYIYICFQANADKLNDIYWLNLGIYRNFVELFPGPHGKYDALIEAGRPDIAILYAVIFLIGNMIAVSSAIVMMIYAKKYNLKFNITKKKIELLLLSSISAGFAIWKLYFSASIYDDNSIISYKLVNSIGYSCLDIIGLVWVYFFIAPMFYGVLNFELGGGKDGR